MIQEMLLQEKIRREEQSRLRATLLNILKETGVDVIPLMKVKYSTEELEDLCKKAIVCLQERITCCNRAYKKLQKKNDTLAQQALAFITSHENKIHNSINEN
jgi:arsenate reductase-like glutaredoxin family protein